MARTVPRLTQDNLEGSIVYFIKKTYKPENGGGFNIEGPYFKKPAIKKSVAEQEILTYQLSKVPDYPYIPISNTQIKYKTYNNLK